MAVKYHCRKCGKRFIDWGAQKLGFKCPDCGGDEELVRLGAADEKTARKPSLKRKPRRIVLAAPASPEGALGADLDDIDAPEPETEVTDSIFLDTEDDDAPVGVDLDDVIPADELAEAEPVDLEVGEHVVFDPAAPIEADVIDEPVVDPDAWTK
ncbi:MAG: hypothetical protein NTU83_00585 [Candidatus Hydrogenedentes bacterium]|nr:hypothetical protein [Candidatus Hydrogenedentota bacterium]